MGVEIERKFLVKALEWEALTKPNPNYLKQAFIAEEDLKVVRVRIYNGKGLLTIKGKSEGIKRLEFEYEIPLEDAQSLIQNLGGPVIEKDRFVIPQGELKWEVDVFYGKNEGLIVAEIELDSESAQFKKPNWVGEEVSDDPRYFNSSLQKHPFKAW